MKATLVSIYFCLTISHFNAQALSPQEIAKLAFPATVVVNSQNKSGELLAFGSGFFIKQDIIVTNLHVIQESARGSIRLVNSKNEFDILGCVGIDATNDLVLLKINYQSPSLLPVVSDSELKIGDEVFAIGNPRGLEGTFSQGMISGKREIRNRSILQITAPISPGSSGGPILSNKGIVIGIAVSYLSDGQNLNFAIPSSCLLQLIRNQTNLVKLNELSKRSGLSELKPDDIYPELEMKIGVVSLKLGMDVNEAFNLLREYYNVQNAKELGFPTDKKYDNLYIVRETKSIHPHFLGQFLVTDGKISNVSRQPPLYSNDETINFVKTIYMLLKYGASSTDGIATISTDFLNQTGLVSNQINIIFGHYKIHIVAGSSANSASVMLVEEISK